MQRRSFMIDLLREDITIENLVELIVYKRELTQEDLTEILVSTKKIKEAVREVRSRNLK